MAQQQAVDQGCDQVVWLDAAEHRWVEEMGGMNLFFVRGGDTAQPWIATPPLTGTLLPGITRDSLLKLAPQLGVKAVEEPITTDQWQAECAAGELTEVFACGTAAVITPVGRVKGETAAVDGRGRRARPGDHAPARGAGRHPVRPQARPVRLDPQGLLSGAHLMIVSGSGQIAPKTAHDHESPDRASRMVRQRRQLPNGCGRLSP